MHGRNADKFHESFSHYSDGYEYIFYKSREDLTCIERKQTNTIQPLDNEFAVHFFEEISGCKEIATIYKNTFKKDLILLLSVCSCHKDYHINSKIINLNLCDKKASLEGIDDTSKVIVKSGLNTMIDKVWKEASEPGGIIGLNYKSLSLALDILKEKKSDCDIMIRLSERYFLLEYQDTTLALKRYPINEDIILINNIIKNTSFDEGIPFKYSRPDKIKESIVLVNGCKVSGRVIRELQKIAKPATLAISQNNIYKISCDNEVVVYVIYPEEAFDFSGSSVLFQHKNSYS